MINKDSFSYESYQFPDKLVNYIEKVVDDLPWLFLKDCTFGNQDHPLKKESNPGFTHSFLTTNGKVGPFFNKMPWNLISEIAGLKDNRIFRSHINLLYPRPDKFNKPFNAHVDNVNPHIVGLYYSSDSDGDTFFFDDDLNIIHREPVKKGKMIVFNGKWKHSGSAPSENVRYALNINYESTLRFDDYKNRLNALEDDISKSKIAEEILINAFEFHSKDNLLEAAYLYEFFLDKGFKDPRVFNNYGIICKQSGQIEKAIKIYNKFIDEYPLNTESYVNLGDLFKDSGDLNEAEKYYSKALDINSNMYKVHFLLATIFISQKRLKEAELSLRKAIKIKPDFNQAILLLSKVLKDSDNIIS